MDKKKELEEELNKTLVKRTEHLSKSFKDFWRTLLEELKGSFLKHKK